jgi:hypothetical protein
VNQCCALTQHSYKTIFSIRSNPIHSEIEVSKHSLLCQNSSKTICPSISDLIADEVEVNQRWEHIVGMITEENTITDRVW